MINGATKGPLQANDYAVNKKKSANREQVFVKASIHSNYLVNNRLLFLLTLLETPTMHVSSSNH